MPNELKIIIDADVSKAIAGVQNLSKVIASDFTKATQVATAAATNLSSEVAASVQKINSSLAGLKITSLDVSVNTSSIDASIKSIQSKFASLVDPELNVLANTAQAEIKIKDLLSELSTLKSSEVFIRANDSQALKVINEVENELKGILDKQIKINVDPGSLANASRVISGDFVKATQAATAGVFDLDRSVAQATARINASIDKMVDDALGGANQLKSSFGDFGKINLDSTQVTAAIEQLKAKIATLQGQIPITVTSEGLEKLNADIKKAKADLNSLVSKNIKVDVDATAALQKIGLLKTNLAALSNVPFKFDTSKAIKGISDLQSKVQNLDQSLKTTSGLNSFQAALGKSTTAIKNLQATGAGLNTFYNNFAAANNKAAAAVARLPQSTNTASFALLNFGRVLQDAPFGILGIANNLNPLIESLGRASAAAKETGTSLSKNLVSALLGPAGIGLAVSAVSSLLIVFGDKLFGAAKSLSLAEIEARKFTASLADIKTGIDQFFSNLEFEQGIEKLKNKLNLGDAAEVFNIGLDKQSADKIVAETNEQIKSAAFRIAEIVNNRTFFLSKSGQKLAEAFFSSLQSGITVDTEGLSKADKKVFDILNEQATRIGALTEQRIKARRKSAEAEVQIEIQKAADLKKALDKQKDDFEKFVNDTIAKAKQFSKEFGQSFVVPDLEESFFRGKLDVFKDAQKLLNNVKSGNLQIKLPVNVAFELLPEPVAISQATIDNFFSDLKLQAGIPIEVIPDLSLSKGSLDQIDKKLDLRKQFSILGDLGLKEFSKIDFSNINAGIAEATKRLEGMMAIATTLNQAIGQGLVSSFNAVFDAILEGKNVFKALGQALKELVVNTIKAVAQMLILRAITNLIFPGGGGAIQSILPRGFTPTANFGQLSGIGSRAFQNVIQVNVNGQISGDTILLAGQRASNSQGRFGG